MTTMTRRDERYRLQAQRYRELAVCLAALLITEAVAVNLADYLSDVELLEVRDRVRLMTAVGQDAVRP